MKTKEFTVKEEELINFKKRRYVRQLCNSALKSGKLVRPLRCELCKGKEGGIEAHHVDYGRPLDIVWLCSICHNRAHLKDSTLNPDNNPQSPMPSIVSKYQNVTISFTIPIRNFLAMKREAERLNTSISKIMRDYINTAFPLRKAQLEFNFHEVKNDKPQNVQLKGVPNLEADKGLLPESKRTDIPKVRSKRNLNCEGMEGGLFPIPGGYGTDAPRLQRTGSY